MAGRPLGPTDIDATAAVLARAEAERVRLSLAPGGGLRCEGRMSTLLRADLVRRKRAVMRALGQGAKTETLAVRASKPGVQSHLCDQRLSQQCDLARAVLIQSLGLQIWVVPDFLLVHEIRAEEALRPEPRPVLLGSRRALIRAKLNVLAVLPGIGDPANERRTSNLMAPAPLQLRDSRLT